MLAAKTFEGGVAVVKLKWRVATPVVRVSFSMSSSPMRQGIRHWAEIAALTIPGDGQSSHFCTLDRIEGEVRWSTEPEWLPALDVQFVEYRKPQAMPSHGHAVLTASKRLPASPGEEG